MTQHVGVRRLPTRIHRPSEMCANKCPRGRRGAWWRYGWSWSGGIITAWVTDVVQDATNTAAGSPLEACCVPVVSSISGEMVRTLAPPCHDRLNPPLSLLLLLLPLLPLLPLLVMLLLPLPMKSCCMRRRLRLSVPSGTGETITQTWSCGNATRSLCCAVVAAGSHMLATVEGTSSFIGDGRYLSVETNETSERV